MCSVVLVAPVMIRLAGWLPLHPYQNASIKETLPLMMVSEHH